jgi:hypothetical protein
MININKSFQRILRLITNVIIKFHQSAQIINRYNNLQSSELKRIYEILIIIIKSKKSVKINVKNDIYEKFFIKFLKILIHK